MTPLRKARRLSGGSALARSPGGISDYDEHDEKERRSRRRSARKARRLSLRSPSGAKSPGKRRAVVEGYTQIIKMSSENKINTKNTWSLHLLDYIDDVLDSQHGNFQKASCTLQASVQIYEKRVESTHADTYKMLENLNRTDSRAHNDGEEARLRRKGGGASSKAAVTLESNLKNIDVKRLEREYDVDPMFRKMSQAFDEGGAKGMLMNNLAVHDGCTILFDTSDAVEMGSTEHRDAANAASATDAVATASPPARGTVGSPDRDGASVDISGLKGKLSSSCDDVERLVVCPSLRQLYLDLETCTSNLRAFSRTDPRERASPRDTLGTIASPAAMCPREGMPSVESFHGGADDFFDDDDGGELALGGFCSDGDANAGGALPRNPGVAGAGAGCGVHQGPGASGEDLLHLRLANAHDSDYSYFDAQQLARRGGGLRNGHENWAGPGHWKFAAKPRRAKGRRVGSAKDNAPKIAFRVDFSVAFSAPSSKFAMPSTPSTILLSRAAKAPDASCTRQHMLPCDVHYKDSDLRRLFLRPSLLLMGRPGGSGVVRGGSAFSAVMARHSDAFENDDAYLLDGFGDDNGNDCGESFGPTMLDRGAADDSFDAAKELELVTAARTIEKISVGYATKAKRVDVKQLKQNLWTEIRSTTAAPAQIEKGGVSASGANENQDELMCGRGKGDDTDTTLSFKSMVETMSPRVSSQVTIPFYFICVLHLANEKGLKLVGDDHLTDFSIELDP